MKNTKLTLFFLIFLIAGLVVFMAACDRAECKTKADCPAGNSCKTVTCEMAKCVTIKTVNCCGNGDAKECIAAGSAKNFCTCPEECREIKNRTKSMSYFCSDDKSEYSLGVPKKEVKSSTVSDEIDFTGFSATAKIKVKTPFDLDTSTYNVDFTLSKLGDGISKPTIKKIEAKTTVNREERLIADKDVNHVLWTADNVANVQMPFENFVDEGSELAIDKINFLIYYEYTQGYGTDAKKKTGVVTYKFSKAITFVNPTFKRKCPISCDDKNSCTDDSCSEQTNFFCEHKIKQNCATNGVCEINENKCTAPEDCGYCTGDYGQYLDMGCTELNMCVYGIKSDSKESVVKQQSKDFGPGKISVEITYDKPFQIGVSTIDASVKITDATDDFESSFEISEMRVMDKSTRLGKSATYSKLVKVGDESTKQRIPLDAKSSVPQFTKSVTLEIDYRYKYKSGTTTKESELQTYSIPIDSVLFVKTGAVN